MGVDSSSEPGPAEIFMHKNHLQEYAQRSALPLPVYQTVGKGSPHALQFRSIVIVDGMTFSSSQSFSSRKEAEQNAAKVALEGISLKIQQDGCPLIRADTTFCKSILHEYAVKMNLEKPTYTCSQLEGPIQTFISSVSFTGKTYTGVNGRNKKEAQQLGARAVIEAILGDCNSSTRTRMSEIIKSKRKLYAAINHISGYNMSPVMHLTSEGNPENLFGTSLVSGKEGQSALTNERSPVVTGNVVAALCKKISETCVDENNSGSIGNETLLLHQLQDGRQGGIVSFNSDAINHINGSTISTALHQASQGKPDNLLENSLVTGKEEQFALTNEKLLVTGHAVTPPSRKISEACPEMKSTEYMHEVDCHSFRNGTSLAHQPQDAPQIAVVSLSSDTIPDDSHLRFLSALKNEISECVPTNCSLGEPSGLSTSQVGPSGCSSGTQEMSSKSKKKRPKKGKRDCGESKPKKSRSDVGPSGCSSGTQEMSSKSKKKRLKKGKCDCRESKPKKSRSDRLVMIGVAVLVVDRLGRRPLLIGGVSGIKQVIVPSMPTKNLGLLIEKD